jgi:hypothetical protein
MHSGFGWTAFRSSSSMARSLFPVRSSRTPFLRRSDGRAARRLFPVDRLAHVDSASLPPQFPKLRLTSNELSDYRLANSVVQKCLAFLACLC